MSDSPDTQHLTLPYPGLILAGGRSRRMGRDKALLPLGSETVLQRVHKVFAGMCCRTVLVMGRASDWSPQVSFDRVVRDQHADYGPLEGLRVGLQSLSEYEMVLVGTCDAPLVVPQVYRAMVDRLERQDQWDAAVPVVRGQSYPLTAVYRTSVIERVSQMVDQQQLRVKDLLSSIQLRAISEAELRVLDPTLQTLRNINTQEEYASLLRELT